MCPRRLLVSVAARWRALVSGSVAGRGDAGAPGEAPPERLVLRQASAGPRPTTSVRLKSAGGGGGVSEVEPLLPGGCLRAGAAVGAGREVSG